MESRLQRPGPAMDWSLLTRLAWLFGQEGDNGSGGLDDDVDAPEEGESAQTRSLGEEGGFVSCSAGSEEEAAPAFRSLGGQGDEEPSGAAASNASGQGVAAKRVVRLLPRLVHFEEYGVFEVGDEFSLGPLTAVVSKGLRQRVGLSGVVGLRIKDVAPTLKAGLDDFCVKHFNGRHSLGDDTDGKGEDAEAGAGFGKCDDDPDGCLEPWLLSVSSFVLAGVALQLIDSASSTSPYDHPNLKSTRWQRCASLQLPATQVHPSTWSPKYTLASIRLAFMYLTNWSEEAGTPGTDWAQSHAGKLSDSDFHDLLNKAQGCRELEEAKAAMSKAAAAQQREAEEKMAATARASVPRAEAKLLGVAVEKITSDLKPYCLCGNELHMIVQELYFYLAAPSAKAKAPSPEAADIVIKLFKHLATRGHELEERNLWKAKGNVPFDNSKKQIGTFLRHLFFSVDLTVLGNVIINKDASRSFERNMILDDAAFRAQENYTFSLKDEPVQQRLAILLKARSGTTELSDKARNYLLRVKATSSSKGSWMKLLNPIGDLLGSGVAGCSASGNEETAHEAAAAAEPPAKRKKT